MSEKRRAWLVIGLSAAVCAAAVWGVAWYRGRAMGTAGAMLQRLETRDAVVLAIDFAALRRAGLDQMLAGSKVAEEPEYREFVRRTGFDYSRDLELAMASFAPDGRYILARGRFDWSKLRAYAEQSSGGCRDGLCRMAGSTAARRISFFPLRDNLLALAVGTDPDAATRLKRAEAGAAPPEIPSDPVWLYMHGSALASGSDLPSGTRMFARGMERAESVLLSLAPEGSRFAVKLDVRCRSGEDAVALAGSLEHTTTLLREMIEREHQAPNPGDLSGVLTSGTFRSEGVRVRGRWPVERAFLASLFR